MVRKKPISERSYRRISWGKEVKSHKFYALAFKNKPCPGCNVDWGKKHYSDRLDICGFEECPVCGGQLASCGHAELIFPAMWVSKKHPGVKDKLKDMGHDFLDGLSEGLS